MHSSISPFARRTESMRTKKRSRKGKKNKKSNPLFIGIVGGLIGAFVVGAILLYFFGHRKQQIYRAISMTSINNADSLLEKNMVEEALTIYNAIASKVSANREPELYGAAKNSAGICYYKLALIKNTEGNLRKAIGAFEDSLKVRTLEAYPVEYAITQNNLGNAYRSLFEARDDEENLTKAFNA